MGTLSHLEMLGFLIFILSFPISFLYISLFLFLIISSPFFFICPSNCYSFIFYASQLQLHCSCLPLIMKDLVEVLETMQVLMDGSQ